MRPREEGWSRELLHHSYSTIGTLLDPAKYVHETKVVTAGAKFAVHMAPGGGFVVTGCSGGLENKVSLLAHEGIEMFESQ